MRPSVMRPSTISARARHTVTALGLASLLTCGTGACSPSTPTATTGATPTPTPSPSTGGPRSPLDSAVSEVELVTPTTGWGLTTWSSDPTQPVQHIIRSTDGGHGWVLVTPPDYTPGRGFLILYARSASEAWASVNGTGIVSASSAPLWHTADGGLTWRASSIATSNPSQITFIDDRHGWIAASPLGGTPGQFLVEVWRTTDGGASWVQISPTAPVLGRTTGLGFRDATTGWAAAGAPGSTAFLSVTHDGGATWQPQALPSPIPTIIQGEVTSTEVLPPAFSNASEGILPVQLGTGAGSGTGVVYLTHTGGSTWSLGPWAPGWCEWSLNASGQQFMACSPSPSSTGASGTPATLYRLSATQTRWEPIPIDPTSQSLLRAITELDMVSATTGWALSSSAGLIATADGGHTWSVLSPLAPG
jgi:photosystem II stability/assembly factor-like uncharacterized protein